MTDRRESTAVREEAMTNAIATVTGRAAACSYNVQREDYE